MQVRDGCLLPRRADDALDSWLVRVKRSLDVKKAVQLYNGASDGQLIGLCSLKAEQR